MSLIEIKNVSYSYDKRNKAVDDVSLCVEKGEFFGIIGPNGSGKTTLLKCISGYLAPHQGQVLIGGRDVKDFSAKEIAKTMALVQQHASLEYDFSVQDIVLTGRNPHLKRMQTESEADYRIARESMERAEILHLKDRLVTELSGGEWQRMILARALAQQASIMLLDEPVSGLDIRHQVAFLKSAKFLSQTEGFSVVCILHDLNLAQQYCDRIALLNEGKLHSLGSPKSVLTQNDLQAVYGIGVNLIKTKGETFVLPKYH
ncbi:MAG: ABC transporter ATP-binding protein [Eubacteriales bacterium]